MKRGELQLEWDGDEVRIHYFVDGRQLMSSDFMSVDEARDRCVAALEALDGMNDGYAGYDPNAFFDWGDEE